MSYLISKKIIGLLLAVCSVFLLISVSKSQEIEYVGSYFFGGEFRSLVIEGQYAYCALNGGFQILDIDDPGAVKPAGANPFMRPRDLQLSDNYAYVTGSINEPLFGIIDIQNPEDPVITATLDSVGHRAIALHGDYAYTINPDTGVMIIHVSDRFNPEVVGTYVNDSDNRDIFISGSYGYLPIGDEGLEIVDISNPAEPVLVTRYISHAGIGSWEVFVLEPYAYSKAGESDGYGSIIEIVDISDPSNPVYMGHIGFDGWYIRKIFADGDHIYAFQEWYWDATLFIIIDVEDPENPYLEWSSEFSYMFGHLDLWISGDRAYLTDSYSLTIMDISTPSSPVDLGGYRSKRGLNRIEVSGNYAYGTFGPMDDDLYIFNVSDLTSPELVADYDVGADAWDLTLAGNYAYVAETSFEIVDISIPGSPSFVAEYGTVYAKGIDVRGEYVYLTVGGSEFQVIDIGDPGNPVLMGQCPAELPQDVFVQDDLAFIAQMDESVGLLIVDISDPGSPVRLGSCATPDYPASVSVRGQYAYLAALLNGVVVVDISDPYNPIPVTYYNTPFRANHVHIRENYAYISDPVYGLHILDISNPLNPVLVTAYDTPGWAEGSFAAGEHIFVADDFSLMILRFIRGPCVYIPGDCDYNGTPLELGDVIAMIGAYRGIADPYYTCECPPHGDDFPATADPNGNCVANELNDVVIEIGAYRGSAEVSGCPDCPGLP
jgi:hypothetical protein